jgi:hypothetical protein
MQNKGQETGRKSVRLPLFFLNVHFPPGNSCLFMALNVWLLSNYLFFKELNTVPVTVLCLTT